MNTAIVSDYSAAPQTAKRKRGIRFYIGRSLKWLGIGLFALAVLGVVYQTIATEMDKGNYAPHGQLYTVNGHQMHLYCVGEGSPTVILEAGAFSYSSEWYWVQNQLAVTHHVCAYDRPGNGWSEAVDGPRDGLTLVHELHDLLAEANVSSPYILAGHSLGGVLNRIYAAQYPDEVLGLALVDSAVPLTWPDISGYEEYKSANQSAVTLMTVLERTSALRIILGNEFRGYGYPAAVAAELTALKSTSMAVATWDAEVRLAQWELSRQAEAAEDLGALPIVVMWAGHPEITAEEDRTKLEAIWDSVPAFSSNNVVCYVEGADHGSIIGSEQYAQQVTAAILDVIASAQTGEPLTR